MTLNPINMTVDEIISYLNHSSIPTLLVEGKDDAQIYRWIEEKLEDLDIDILPCGGRNSLLEIFDKKMDIIKEDVLFLADLDLWLFSGIPSQYKDIIFTKGYSIENDIYSSAKEGLESLINPNKIEDYSKAIDELSKWYSFEVNEHLNARDYHLDVSPKRVLDNKTFNLSQHYINHRNYQSNNTALYQEIKNSYELKIRGKNLLDLWEWFVEDKSLKRGTIFEIIFKLTDDNEFILEFIDKIKSVNIK